MRGVAALTLFFALAAGAAEIRSINVDRIDERYVMQTGAVVSWRLGESLRKIYFSRNQNLAVISNEALTKQTLSLITLEIFSAGRLSPCVFDRARPGPRHTG